MYLCSFHNRCITNPLMMMMMTIMKTPFPRFLTSDSDRADLTRRPWFRVKMKHLYVKKAAVQRWLPRDTSNHFCRTAASDRETVRRTDRHRTIAYTSLTWRRSVQIQIDKNSSGDEIANVNFYAVRPGVEFAEITQNNDHYAVQGYLRSPILVPVESSYTISY